MFAATGRDVVWLAGKTGTTPLGVLPTFLESRGSLARKVTLLAIALHGGRR